MGEEQPNAEEKPIVSDEPFTLKIPDYGRNLSFDGPSDFKEWVDKEHEAWKEITGVNQVVRLGGDQAVENHRKFFMRLASNADTWVNSTEEPASRNALAVVIQMTPCAPAGRVSAAHRSTRKALPRRHRGRSGDGRRHTPVELEQAGRNPRQQKSTPPVNNLGACHD